MDYLPLHFKLNGQRCLVVGAGQRAARKMALLVQAGAVIRVVAPQIDADVEALLHDQPRHEIHQRPFQNNDVLEDGETPIRWVIAVTNDDAVNQQVAQCAATQRLPVNVLGHPQLSNFIIPALIDRSPVMVSVSSSGDSPVLTRLLRGRLESLIPAAYGRLAQLVADTQATVKQRLPTVTPRRRFWERVLNGPAAEAVLSGDHERALQRLKAELADAESASARLVGEVYLIGAGPGDPDLLTFKALRLMQQADVVLYDRLVSKQVLDLCRRDARKIYVGKAKSQHAVPQATINQRLVDFAETGQRVARLKGGDPFIFGRGGEEIEQLMDNDIPFQVVPGVTAASGCAAYAGIPLTHRDYAQSVRFVTGHLKDGTPELNWPDLVQDRQTVVFYMGLVGLERICAKLLEHGMAADMPMALVQQGTTVNHKVIVATLATMPKTIEQQAVQPPTLMILGDVVRLRQRLNWFDAKQAVASFTMREQTLD